MNKYDIQRLRRKIKTVNRRIKELDKRGLSNIPTINTVRGALGGKMYFPSITRNISEDEFEHLKQLTDVIFNDTRTTVSGAVKFEEGRKEMFSNMLRGVLGREVSGYELNRLMDYIPYEDMRVFLDDYIYEHIVDTALQLMNSGVTYSRDYMETALTASVGAVISQVIVDTGAVSDEDISKGIIGDMTYSVLNGSDIETEIQRYLQGIEY